MATVGSIVVSLVAETAEFATGMKRAESEIKRVASSAQQSQATFAGLGVSMNGMAGGLDAVSNAAAGASRSIDRIGSTDSAIIAVSAAVDAGQFAWTAYAGAAQGASAAMAFLAANPIVAGLLAVVAAGAALETQFHLVRDAARAVNDEIGKGPLGGSGGGVPSRSDAGLTGYEGQYAPMQDLPWYHKPGAYGDMFLDSRTTTDIYGSRNRFDPNSIGLAKTPLGMSIPDDGTIAKDFIGPTRGTPYVDYIPGEYERNQKKDAQLAQDAIDNEPMRMLDNLNDWLADMQEQTMREELAAIGETNKANEEKKKHEQSAAREIMEQSMSDQERYLAKLKEIDELQQSGVLLKEDAEKAALALGIKNDERIKQEEQQAANEQNRIGGGERKDVKNPALLFGSAAAFSASIAGRNPLLDEMKQNNKLTAQQLVEMRGATRAAGRRFRLAKI